MGGSKPSAPKVIMPAPTAPIVFQSVVPEQSYRDLAAQLGRYQEQQGEIAKQKYAEVGTPAEIGARQAARDVKSEQAYLASLPGGRDSAGMDRYKAYTTGLTGGLETASGTYNEPDTFTRSYSGSTANLEPSDDGRRTALSAAQSQYAGALSRIGEVPSPTKTENPSWANEEAWKGAMDQTKTIETGKKEEAPSPTPSPTPAPSYSPGKRGRLERRAAKYKTRAEKIDNLLKQYGTTPTTATQPTSTTPPTA